MNGLDWINESFGHDKDSLISRSVNQISESFGYDRDSFFSGSVIRWMDWISEYFNCDQELVSESVKTSHLGAVKFFVELGLKNHKSIL